MYRRPSTKPPSISSPSHAPTVSIPTGTPIMSQAQATCIENRVIQSTPYSSGASYRAFSIIAAENQRLRRFFGTALYISYASSLRLTVTVGIARAENPSLLCCCCAAFFFGRACASSTVLTERSAVLSSIASIKCELR